MRILLLTDWAYPCDHRFLNEVFGERFSEAGHEVVAVFRRGEGIEPGEHDWGGNKSYVLSGEAYNPVRTSLKAITGRLDDHELVSRITNLSTYDAVHVRNDLSMGILGAYLKDQFNLSYAHQISYFKAEAMIRLARQEPGISSVSRYAKGGLGMALRAHLCSKADVVFPISEAMQSDLEARGYSSPMVPIPTGAPTEINPEYVESKKFYEKFDIPDKDRILYMGTMSPLRELELLFDTLSILREKRDVKLVMVGGRDKANRRRLERAADKAGVSKHTHFTGWIDDSELLYSGIRGADVGLSPIPPNDLLRTNAPIKLLEYLTFETAVVASDTPDQREVVESSGGGRIVPHNPESFASSTVELLENDELRSQMGKRGRRYVQRHRSFDSLTNRLLNAYYEHFEFSEPSQRGSR